MERAKRSCVCGTLLAHDNGGPQCSPCERAGAILRFKGEHGPMAIRLGRRLAEVYSGYADSDSRASFLSDLTLLLDGLCDLFGHRSPVFEGIDKPLRIEEVA